MNAHTRIQWLHKKMTVNSYPNAQRLAERFDALVDVAGLGPDIFFIVKADLKHRAPPRLVAF